MNQLQTDKASLLSKCICICFGVVTLCMAMASSINLIDHSSLFAIFVCYTAPPLFLFIVMRCMKTSKERQKLFGLMLFCIALILKCIVAFAINTQPESDFYLMYETANQLAQGVNTLPETSYFQYWPYQSAFVAWMAFFIRFFGADILFFKGMNCLLSACTSLLVYLLARRVGSERGARVAAIVFTLYPGTFTLVSVLTNQHLSECLFVLSLYVFTTPSRGIPGQLARSTFAGVLLALSNAIRPNGILVIAAVVVYGIVKVFSWIRNRGIRLKSICLRAAALCVVYGLAFSSLSTLVSATGLNPSGLSNNVPEWKWIVGLNEDTTGRYSGEDAKIVFGEERNQEAIDQLLQERLSISPARFFSLAWKKIIIMWGSYEPTYWAFTNNVFAGLDDARPLQTGLRRMCKLTSGLYIWVQLLMAVGIIMAFRKGQISEVSLLLMLIALAYFNIHLLIEVQTRYRSLMTTVTFPLIASGVDVIWGGCTRFKKRIGYTGKRQQPVKGKHPKRSIPVPF